jgi:pimeloyl-ACP methyl ester carboxylesterase
VRKTFPADAVVVRLSVAGRNVSAVYCAATLPKKSPPLVFVHGAGSSAATMTASTMAMLRATHDVIAVDLPGIAANAHAADAADPFLLAADADECLAFYAAFFDQLLLALGGPPPVIVAHSFGAFLAVKSLLRRHDDHRPRIAGLVLVSPAGLLPAPGDLGRYWAVYFRLPRTLMRLAASLVLAMNDDSLSTKTTYWLHVQAAAPHVNVPAKFVAVTPLDGGVYWTRPMLNQLLQRGSSKQMPPVAMIWGEEDGITPIATGRLVAELANISLEPLVGVGHSPFHDHAAVFVAALHRTLERFQKEKEETPQQQQHRVASLAPPPTVVLPPGRWKSYFSLAATHAAMAELRRDLLRQLGKGGEQKNEDGDYL